MLNKTANPHYFGIATFSRYPIIHKGEIRFKTDENNICIYSDIVVKQDTLRIYNAHLSSLRLQKADYEWLSDLKKKGIHEANKNGAEQKVFEKTKNAFIKRTEQINKVTAHIKQSPYPVVLCGDFNDTPISWSYQTISKELRDAFTVSGNGIGDTHIGLFPVFRIDYIFHSPSLNSYKFTTHQEKLSDHKAISCQVSLPL